MRHFFGFGQVIESSVDLPGALLIEGRAGAAPDLIIQHAEIPADEAIGPAGFSRDSEGLLLEIPDLAGYRCRARTITVLPRTEEFLASATAVAEHLIASALPATLWMQGRLVLHAAAVCAPAGGPALAILGRSQAGKSTLAMQLVAGGARLLADDSIAIAFDSGGPVASGLPGGLFLRDSGETGRRFQPVAVEPTIKAAPLGALIILDGGAEIGQLTPLDRKQALKSILTYRHRPRAPDLLGMRVKVLEDCVQLARSTPAYALQRPHDSQSTIETGGSVRWLLREALKI